jgi:hypothetical protein
MTKAELIQMLSSLPDDAIIVLSDGIVGVDTDKYICKPIVTVEEVNLITNKISEEEEIPLDDTQYYSTKLFVDEWGFLPLERIFKAYCIQSESL